MKPLAVSFSGGRSSAVMARLCVDKWRRQREIVVTFANTGAEHPETLDFVDRCDRAWNLGVVWIEAKVDPRHGHGVRHRIVSHATASRDGRPFRDYVRKYGLPGPGRPHCTSRLKIEPMESFIRRELGWARGEHETAVGIRCDEIDRMNERADELGIIYPLVDGGWTKDRVNAYMETTGFDLALPGDHYGNCVACWKKATRKLATIAQDDERWFEIARMLEREARAADSSRDGSTMYREHRTVDDIVTIARSGAFDRHTDNGQRSLWHVGMESENGAGCSESCEAF